MRQLHLSEKGSANWPFVITLVLLIAFGYLWFDERDRREVAEDESAKATIGQKAAEQAASVILDYGDRVTKLVGYADYQAKDLIPEVDTSLKGQELKDAQEMFDLEVRITGARLFTNLDKLKGNLTRDGTVGGKPGLLNILVNDAKVDIVQSMRVQGSDDVPETVADFEWMTPEFKQKLAEVKALEIPRPPVVPSDPDDVEEVEKYEEDLEAYEEAVANLEKALDELHQMEGHKKWDSIIKPPRRFNPDQEKTITLEFFTQPFSGQVTIETLLGYPPKTISSIIDEFRKNMEADSGIIAQVRGDAAAKDNTINELQSDLSAEQQRHTQEVQQLQGELAVSREQEEGARLDTTTALQRVQVVEEEKRRDVTELESRNSALENRIRIDKEERDLKIRQDRDDGAVLSSSPTMQTAIIDLGSNDRIYPGLKFDVSFYGRGGMRLPKGKIMVTRVLGKKSSKVAIISEMPGNPIGRGDVIHNRFWSATEPIHIYLAGELEKYPMDIAHARLARMGVTIDAQVNGDTDYIVVPDSMTAVAAVAEGEDEEDFDDEEAVGGKTEFERVQALARAFGATVITEKILNEFLDY